ncbi:MAG: Lrp/AsnC ligand binding domain-containing protein [Candidatus Thorarchaeota archaeon]|nr:Lrp/AsnC ligand binding domain-containing protein [Candidatus Thorarchaeota archaeon]
MTDVDSKLRVILQIYVESRDLDEVSSELVKLPGIVDVYEVTGESDIIVMIEADDVIAFRDLLKNRILPISGIRSTVSSVVTYIHKKDGRVTD